jgi:hypothetical protein
MKWAVRACNLELINSKIIKIADSSSFFPVDGYPIRGLPAGNLLYEKLKKLQHPKVLTFHVSGWIKWTFLLIESLSNQQKFLPIHLCSFTGVYAKKQELINVRIFTSGGFDFYNRMNNH